jgi:hypothetical protein
VSQQSFGVSFNRLADDSLQIVVSTPERGYIADFTQPHEDAINNLTAAARVMGYRLVQDSE